MKIKIIFEDQNLIVIDKPAGLVVHPGAGEHKETLVDWIINQYPAIKNFSWPYPFRPGIVHRLDKDTSGAMVIAKNPETLKKLQELFLHHKVSKIYQVLIFGKLKTPSGEISSFIGRDPYDRHKQVSKIILFDFEPGIKRESKTEYQVLQQYQYKKNDLTLVEAKLHTGRMHQLRVHFKTIGHPIIGDQIYHTKPSKKISADLGITRQFLHSYSLEFNQKKFVSPLPKDLKTLIAKLSKERAL